MTPIPASRFFARLSGPTVFVTEDNPGILQQTAEVETICGEIVIREVVDQFGAGRIQREIALDPMQALQLGEEICRQAMEAMS